MKDNMFISRMKLYCRAFPQLLAQQYKSLLLIITSLLAFWLFAHWQLMATLGASLEAQHTAELKQEAQLKEQQELLKIRDFLKTELSVEKDTNQLLQQDLKDLQQQVFDLKKQLSAYQQIVSSDPAAGTLAIDSFRLEPKGTARQFGFNLLLIEQNKAKTQTRAVLDIWLIATQKKRKVRLDALKLAGFKTKKRRLLIKNFQTVEGEFSLPSNVAVSAIEIKVSSNSGPSGATVLRTKQYDWDGISEILD